MLPVVARRRPDEFQIAGRCEKLGYRRRRCWRVPAGNASAQDLLDFLFGRPPDRSSSPPPRTRCNSCRPGTSMPGPSGPAGPGTMTSRSAIPISAAVQPIACACATAATFRWSGTPRCAGAALQRAMSREPDKDLQRWRDRAFGCGRRRALGDLKTAYLYRKQIVPDCTCNGRDIFGLAPIDVKTDPTFRAGDTVATADGVIVVTRPPRAQ